MKRLRYEIEFENGAKVSDRVGSGDLSARAGLIPEQGAADTRKNTTEQKGRCENVKNPGRRLKLAPLRFFYYDNGWFISLISVAISAVARKPLLQFFNAASLTQFFFRHQI